MALDRLTQITNSGITSGITITGVNLTGVITATSANVGSGITLSGTQINVGSATTIHSGGFQIGSSNIHSGGITLNSINASGVVTATTFVGSLTGNATGLSGTPSITVATINASNATFSGNVSVAGTVTYEDVTNVDSVGIITARSGVVVNSGGLTVTGISSFYSDGTAPSSTVSPAILLSSGNSSDKPVVEIRQGRYNRDVLTLSSNQSLSANLIRAHENGTNRFTVDGSGNSYIAGNLGVGTANPQYPIHLFKTSYPELNIGTGTVTATYGIDTGTNTVVLGSTTNHSLSIRTAGTGRLNIENTGNITFYTNSVFDASNYLTLQNNTNSYGRIGLVIKGKTFNGANNPSANDGWSLASGRSQISIDAYLTGDTDYDSKFSIQHLLASSTNAAVGDLGFLAKAYSTTAPAMTLTAAGNFGLGTATPTKKLDVRGSFYQEGGQTILRNGNRFYEVYTIMQIHSDNGNPARTLLTVNGWSSIYSTALITVEVWASHAISALGTYARGAALAHYNGTRSLSALSAVNSFGGFGVGTIAWSGSSSSGSTGFSLTYTGPGSNYTISHIKVTVSAHDGADISFSADY